MSGALGHNHGARAVRSSARHVCPLALSFVLLVAFMIVQVSTALITGSLALLSDAGHMATEALGVAMALAVIQAELAEHYGITHATLQVEPDDHHGCDELTW